jgi:hypothetical protein
MSRPFSLRAASVSAPELRRKIRGAVGGLAQCPGEGMKLQGNIKTTIGASASL